jgi:hypothetical protein
LVFSLTIAATRHNPTGLGHQFRQTDGGRPAPAFRAGVQQSLEWIPFCLPRPARKSALAMPYDQFESWIRQGMKTLNLTVDDSVKEMLEAVRKVRERN